MVKKKRKIAWMRLLMVSMPILIPAMICSPLLVDHKEQEFKPRELTNLGCNDLFKKPTKEDFPEIVIPKKEPEPELISLGEFKLTGYCSCELCCGIWADGITAMGTYAEEGRTIAVDPRIIPLGSEVIINGNTYIAEDTGSAINQNKIDIFRGSHSACFDSECNGYAEVFVVRG